MKMTEAKVQKIDNEFKDGGMDTELQDIIELV